MLKQALEALAAVVAALAPWSKTKLDDELLALLRIIVADEELIAWLDRLIHGPAREASNEMAACQNMVSAAPPVRLLQATTQAGLDWNQVIATLLPILLALLRQWISNPQGPALPPNVPPPPAQYRPSTTPRC